MAPVRSYTNWNSRTTDEEEQIEPYRKYFFICEGANTETWYFKKLIDIRKELNIHPLIDIRLLEKTEGDRDISFPRRLIEFAENQKENPEIAFDKERDKMIVVFDGDIFEEKVLDASLVEAMGGEVVRIAAGSRDHINAMDMVDGYGDGGDPVIEKSQFILSLFEQLDKKGINAKERSIIDRCVGEVYEEYQHGGAVPTLRVLREKFLEQEEPEAQDLALVSELFTNGSLDAFAHESNVDVNNRIMVYDILDLGKQLKTMGLLVITDAMLNRVTENWKQGKRTHIFLDEFHVVFENEYSGAFFNSAWRRFRKRNAFPTAITQNVEYLLDSVLASTMISNSEYIVMLNQAEPDRAKLATLLNISAEQMGYITNADAGCGLVKYGSSLVPFVNRFPTNTRLYKLMTTKPGEDSINRGRM